jgi:hypothetical protein
MAALITADFQFHHRNPLDPSIQAHLTGVTDSTALLHGRVAASHARYILR